MPEDESETPEGSLSTGASIITKKPVETIEIFSKIVIPIILAATGILFTYLNHSDDKTRLNQVHADDTRRLDQDKNVADDKQNEDADANFVQLIITGNEKLRLYAYDMLQYRSRHKNIPDDLLAVLDDLCKGHPPEIASDQKACDIIHHNQQVASTQQTNNQAEVDQIKVFLQIASESQRTNALTLEATLASNKFSPEEIELVKGSVATVHTYVRFFSASGALQASKVKDIMDKLGYKDVGIQDMSADVEKPLSLIEVWIGKSQPEL